MLLKSLKNQNQNQNIYVQPRGPFRTFLDTTNPYFDQFTHIEPLRNHLCKSVQLQITVIISFLISKTIRLWALCIVVQLNKVPSILKASTFNPFYHVEGFLKSRTKEHSWGQISSLLLSFALCGICMLPCELHLNRLWIDSLARSDSNKQLFKYN